MVDKMRCASAALSERQRPACSAMAGSGSERGWQVRGKIMRKERVDGGQGVAAGKAGRQH